MHTRTCTHTHTQRCVSVKVWRGGVDCCCHDCQTRRQLLQHMCEHFATKRDGMGQPTIPFLHHHGQCHNLDHCCKIPSLPRHRVGCGVSEDGHSSSTTWQAVSTMHRCMIHRVCIHNVHQNIFLVRPIRSSFGMMSDTHTRVEKKRRQSHGQKMRHTASMYQHVHPSLMSTQKCAMMRRRNSQTSVKKTNAKREVQAHVGCAAL